MTIINDVVHVGTSAVSLAIMGAGDTATVQVRNDGTASVFLGDAAVAVATGYELVAGGELSIDLAPGEVLYARAAAGTVNVQVLETLTPAAPAYFTVAELRAAYPDLADQEPEVTDERIIARRDEVEQRLESRRLCNVAFVPRTASEIRSGDGSRVLKVAHLRPRAIVTATIAGTDLDVDGVTPSRSGFVRTSAWPPGLSNIALTYTHGHDAPPATIKEAAMLWVFELLVRGPISERAIARATEDGGRIALATPTLLGSKSGIPAVDEAILECREEPSVL